MNMALAGGAADGASTAGSSGGAAPPPMDLTAFLPEGWETEGGRFTRAAGTLLSNPFFSAGAGLWLLTVGGTVGRRAMTMAEALLRRRFMVSMEMTNMDSSYDWMMRWLALQPRFKVQQMSVLTRAYGSFSANDRMAHETLFGPCPNVRHWFFYEGRPMMLSRRRNEAQAFGGEVLETLQFTTIGTSAAILEKLMAEAQQFNADRDSDKTVVYTNVGGRWSRQQGSRQRRPISSVVLAGDTSDTILADVKQFLGSNAYYRDLGVPYRRGYLLHGPPGCGKTSYVMALAGELRLAICVLSLSNRGLTDESLGTLLNTTEMHSIILMEDIDRAFSNESSVTMSGLLNALDGVGAQEGRLVFMTTNHVEVLDPALIRPGRADVKVEVGLLDRTQAVKMFQKFYPTAPRSLQEAFAEAVPPDTLSVAQIQSHLFFNRDNPQGAVDSLRDFLRASTSFEQKVKQKREAEEKRKRMANLPRSPLLDFE